MEGLIVVLVVIALVAFDAIALRFGVDSRPVEDRPRRWL